MNEPVWIGADIGTTGVRAIAYGPDGHSYCAASRDYRLYTPQPGWAEQESSEVVAALENVLREVAGQLERDGRKADGIAFSSVFHSFLVYDERMSPLTRLMTWGDSRSQAIVAEMKRNGLDILSIYHRVGCPVHPMYPMTKIAWVLKQGSEFLHGRQPKRFGSIKDYVFWLLTGCWVLDRSIASGTGLYNELQLEWDKELVRFLGIQEESLPEVVPTTYSRPLTADAARRIGLPAGIPVVIGAGDGVLVNVGIGAVRPGQMSLTIGTSGAVRMLADRPRTDEKGRTWCYNLTDKVWVLGGAINNGGIVLRWFRDNFGTAEQTEAEARGVDAYELLIQAAAQISPGSDGLILLPFFLGERAPNWNADARGVLFGLNLTHGRSHLIRATMEGICFRMNSIMLALEQVAGPAREIRVSGSFTRSELWMQMLADVLGRDVNSPSIQEGAAFGAAVLGFVSAGVLSDIADTANLVTVARSFKPVAKTTEQYRRLYDIYEQVYWNLQQAFTDISAYQADYQAEHVD
jgi:gluconokinase